MTSETARHEIGVGQHHPRVAFSSFARAATRRYVAPPLILSLIVSLATLSSFMGLVLPLGGELGESLNPLFERFLGNGFSRAIVVVCIAALIYSGLAFLGLAVDRNRLRWLHEGGAEKASIWLALLAGRPTALEPADWAGWANSLQEKDIDLGEPHDAADRYSLQRHRNAEQVLLPLRFTVWMLPLLGFIGTVVGIARSIVGLETVIATGAGGQASEGLLTVLGGLQFAFDTTLLGLVSVIPVMMLQMILSGRENDLTAAFHHRVLALLSAGDSRASSSFSGPAETVSHWREA